MAIAIFAGQQFEMCPPCQPRRPCRPALPYEPCRERPRRHKCCELSCEEKMWCRSTQWFYLNVWCTPNAPPYQPSQLSYGKTVSPMDLGELVCCRKESSSKCTAGSYAPYAPCAVIYLTTVQDTDIWQGDVIEFPAWSGRLYTVGHVWDTRDERIAELCPLMRWGTSPCYSPFYSPIPWFPCLFYPPWAPYSPYAPYTPMLPYNPGITPIDPIQPPSPPLPPINPPLPPFPQPIIPIVSNYYVAGCTTSLPFLSGGASLNAAGAGTWVADYFGYDISLFKTGSGWSLLFSSLTLDPSTVQYTATNPLWNGVGSMNFALVSTVGSSTFPTTIVVSDTFYNVDCTGGGGGGGGPFSLHFDNSTPPHTVGSVQFDGSNLVYGTGDRGFSFWAQVLGGSSNSAVFQYGGTLTEFGAVLYAPVSGSITLAMTGLFSIPTASIPEDTNWHHFAISVNGGTLNIYIDGVLKTSVPAVVPSTPIGPTCYIGCNDLQTASECFTGRMTDWRFYNVGLTSGDVTTLYNGGVPQTSNTVGGLVAWFKCSEGTGTTVADSSGNGTNGVITGSISGGQPVVPGVIWEGGYP
jgi:Concanavalin A-like lectin/glucanases superfamily